MIQTLVYKVTIGPNSRKTRQFVRDGNYVKYYRTLPNFNHGEGEYYYTARLITKKDKKSTWYQTIYFIREAF